MSRAAAGKMTGEWPGSSWGLLRDPTQSQYIKANVADSHRLVQVKLYNGDLLGGAFMTKKASAVATVKAKRGSVRGWSEKTAPGSRDQPAHHAILINSAAKLRQFMHKFYSMKTKFLPIIKLSNAAECLI